MKGRNNTWTDMAAAAAFAAVLGISAFWGQHDRAYDQAGTAGIDNSRSDTGFFFIC